MLRGEEAWAEARFRESHWNQEDPECHVCGGEIDDNCEYCLSCGAEYETEAQRRRRNEEDRAEYLNQVAQDDRLEESWK